MKSHRGEGSTNRTNTLCLNAHRVLPFDAQRASESAALKATSLQQKNADIFFLVKHFFGAIYLLFFSENGERSSIPICHTNQSVITAIKCCENSLTHSSAKFLPGTSKRNTLLAKCFSIGLTKNLQSPFTITATILVGFKILLRRHWKKQKRCRWFIQLLAGIYQSLHSVLTSISHDTWWFRIDAP